MRWTPSTVGITQRKRVNWVLDADIRDFFGQLDHSWLAEGSSEHRIADEAGPGG